MVILDIPTLQVVAALGSILSGLVHFCPGMTSREPGRWACWWGSGKVLIGVTNALGLCFDGTRLSASERIIDLVFLVGLCLCIHALSVFARWRPPAFLTLMLAGMTILTVILILFGSRDVRLPIMVLGGTRTLFNFTAALILFRIARSEGLRTAWAMGVLFAATMPLFLARTALLLLAWNDPAWDAWAQWTADWSVGIAIILVSLCHFALLLIDAERVQRSLSEQASHDFLTGALNRFGLGRIEASLRGALALLLIDVDRFKALNDGQGHAAGDAVLRLLSDLAQAEMGTRGTLVRIGGDEFLCVLPGCDERMATDIAGRLSDRFDRSVAAVVDGPLYPSLSIGVVQGIAAGSLDPLIRQADAAMYAVKRTRHAAHRIARAA